MLTFKAQFDELFRDRSRLDRLIALAKRLRKISDQKLMFLGPSIIARYYWCAMQSGYAAWEDELDSFSQYLAARIYNAHALGLIREIPEDDNDILQVGDEITLDDVWGLFSNNQAFSMKGDGNNYAGFDTEYLLKRAKVEKSPLTRGLILEQALAERYRTISWGFAWGEFVVVGEPDGITERLVYEFKTTTTFWYMKPVAFAQADLYAYFFEKEFKRVQIYSVDKGEMHTWEEPADTRRAEETLQKFAAVIGGELPPPPKAWKCKTCKFVQRCPIKPSHQLDLFGDAL